MAREIRDNQSYRDRLLKLIPSEIVAAFLVIEGMLEPSLTARDLPVAVSWAVFALLFVLTPVYLCQVHQVRRLPQLALTTVTFAVWVYTLGGPFKYQGWHSATIASVVLVLWTLVIPLVPNGAEDPPPPAATGGAAGEPGA
jgi:hypothetical protein